MPDTGVCPVCQRARAHIEVYWKGALYKFGRTKKRVLHGYDSAVSDLIVINSQIKDGKFSPSEWLAGKIQARLLRNVLHLWLADKAEEEKQGKMAPGLANYPSYVRKYYVPLLGGLDIAGLDKHSIQKFYHELEKFPIKHKTQKNILDGLRAFLKWALNSPEDYIQAIPPFPTVRITDATPQRTVDVKTQQEGISRIPLRHRDPFIVLADMCLRPGEVVAFRIKDYEPELGGIWKQRTESKNRIKENTKQNKKVCKLLPDDSLAIVKKHVAGRWNDKDLEEPLFVNPDTGRRYTTKMLRVLWKQYSGLTVKLYEGSKHSSLTHLADETGDPFLVQAAADHSDIRTSQKYVHNSQAKLRQALNDRKKVAALSAGRPRVERLSE